MNNAEKELRNRELILKRIENPQIWTWGELGRFYRIKRYTARDIFERHRDKYVNKKLTTMTSR